MGTMRWFFALTIVVLLVPAMMPVIAGAMARLLGGALNEGGPPSRRVGSFDIGHALYRMYVAGWSALATVPAAAGVAVIWGVTEIGIVLFG